MANGSKSKVALTDALSLKPQARRVLRHLEKHNYITPAIAVNTYSIWRLAACIHDLRNIGLKVVTEIKRDAAGHRYAYYRLAA